MSENSGLKPTMRDIPKENEELLTPEGFARWVWQQFCGFPVTEPYDSEWELLLNNARRLDRAAFTKGLHEGVRQGKELRP